MTTGTTSQAATPTPPPFPDEVITQALLQTFALPGVDKPVALVTLDNGHDHTRPSSMGPGGLAALAATLDEALAAASRGEIAAICVTGKPFIFLAGADLSGMPLISDREQALAVAGAGPQTFRRLRDSPVPTFAFVNGVALGGGLEIALHCHYRTISTGAGAVAFPETFLGLVPGWGGTWITPHLIGPELAVKLIIENPLERNRTLSGAQAFEMGLADALFEPADFLELSLRWAARVLTGDVTVDRPPVPDTSWGPVLDEARQLLDARLHGAAPAPYRALDLIAQAEKSSYDEGVAASRETLADLLLGDELRAGLYAFDLVNKRARRPVGVPADKPRKVTKVGVVGAGLMASQLALLFVRKLKVPVVLTDLDADRLDRGVGYVQVEIDKLAAGGRITPDQANRYKGLVSGSLDQQAFADADAVIEAVFENLDVKREVFAGLEKIISPECLLLTNTSSLSITAMADGLEHPERVVGLHFFNPVAVLPLVEVVRAGKTDDASLATTFSIARKLGKNAVLVADRPAFVVNRILTRFLGEVIRAIEEGAPIDVADHAFDPLGLPMSPMNLLALVGPAVALHVAETMHEAFPDRFGVSEGLRRMVEAGLTSPYTFAGGRQVVDPRVAAMFTGTNPPAPEQILERATAALADEIRRTLDEQVVSAPQDIDLCMILGAGWPFHLGGITPYLDRTGVSQRVSGRRLLPPGVATRA